MVDKEIPDVEDTGSLDEEHIWDESKLKLIEYSLGDFRNDILNVRNNRCMQKQGHDSGFQESTCGCDRLNENFNVCHIDSPEKPKEDIVGSGGKHEKFVIKGGLKNGADNGLTKIAHCITGAQKSCDSASEKLEPNNISAWKKTKTFTIDAANSTADAMETGYDAIGNAWDSTVNFLRHPWNATPAQTEATGRYIDTKDQDGAAVQDGVDLTKNKTSSAWENTTNFATDVKKAGKAMENTLL